MGAVCSYGTESMNVEANFKRIDENHVYVLKKDVRIKIFIVYIIK
jgi:hypothetical protein